MREHYLKILSLRPGATEAEIKKAYRSLSKKYHPDISKEPNAVKKFIEIDRAYDYLVNKKNTYSEDFSAEFNYSTPQETKLERWRREARERRRKATQEKAQYQLKLTIKINQFAKILILPLLIINVIFALDFLLPRKENKQQITKRSQVYERARYGRKYYSFDRLEFENVVFLVERGSNASIKEASSGNVFSTLILNSPRKCEVFVNGSMIELNQILGIYDMFGFIIPLVIILGLLFFYRIKSPNGRLSIACILFFIFFFQLYVFLST
ncbi:DnaJ domain-containing protein [Ekhidna sp.]|uniref:DnaJ domain-containing protein n=1 Tax=Ekhidna sp. TaxID=2608089 RepID=UPI003C7D8798